MRGVGLQGTAEELVYKAWMDGYMVGSPTAHLMRNYRERGGWAKLPDRCKPGGLISALPAKTRKAVKQLKAEHFNHRC